MANHRGAMSRELVLITYTTRYREGGARLAQAARTLARERRSALPHAEVRLLATETKAEFIRALEVDEGDKPRLRELHFVGHSGMYGPMFGTRGHPEQLSPHEWRSMSIPFTPQGEAFFHACRSARFFAPFFARTHDVPCSGFHWYTSFSTRRDRFRWMPAWYPESAALYAFGMPGRRSHGLVGSARKHLGLTLPERLKRFLPTPPAGDPSYDAVADLYDDAFDDIRVRADEWRYISQHLPNQRPRVLDIGCGNGALLQAMSDRIGPSAGVDSSEAMLACARQRCGELGHVRFAAVRGPLLPFDDNSFEVAVSLLSFRYLDWDPLMEELARVLTPGGKLLVIDMVTAPLRLREWPRTLRDGLSHRLLRRSMPRFDQALSRLVSAPAWADMLRENPIRAEHELRWYLESRFVGRRVEILNMGRHNRVLAFDSGPFHEGHITPQSYP